LTNVNGKLYFSANDGSDGFELWQSNGTSAGTAMVQDIRPGVRGSDPAYLTNVSGHLFFSANDGTHGFELWDPVAGAPPVPVLSSTPAPSSPPAAPTPAAATPASGGQTAAPPPAASSGGTSPWQQAFWLEALLLLDPNAGALGEEMALLALLPGDSALALDLLMADLASGTAG
jgi:ELWxxDGT repeat protein